MPPNAWAAEPAEPLTLTRGRVSIAISPFNSGMKVTCDGIDVILGSNIVVTKPPWAPHYYLGPSPEALRGAKITAEGDVQRLVLEHRGGVFTGTETITLNAQGRIEQVFEGQVTRDEALIQWRIGGLNPAILIGRSYTVVGRDGQLTEGTVPVTPLTGETDKTQLARGFAGLRFESRIGPIAIDVEGDQTLIVYDFRKDKWAEPDKPLFWFGDLGTRFTPGKPLRYRIVYQLPQFPGAIRPPKGDDVTGAVQQQPHAQQWVLDEPPLILPRPKVAQFATGAFQLPEAIRAYVIADEAARPAADRLTDLLGERFNVGIDARLGLPGMEPCGIAFVRPEDGTADWPAEAYKLTIRPDGVTIAARDAAGYMHGVHTLIQLAYRTPSAAAAGATPLPPGPGQEAGTSVDAAPNDDATTGTAATRPQPLPGREGAHATPPAAARAGRVLLRCAEIYDYPALSFRGIHLFTGGQGNALHLKLIDRIIAALKLNHLVIECEYIKWDAHPNIHHPEYGMPKDQVREILAACRRLGIEVTPLVMALGHMQWMFYNDQNLDLAEDPEAKWAYCVTNPKTYDFIFSIFQEALDLFQPKMLHIGHDEFTHRGRYPYRESSQAHSVDELLLMDTLKLHGWLKERGVQTMMWGDMLLAKGQAPDADHAETPEQAQTRRDKLPKDIVIADWHYVDAPPEKFTSLGLFHEAGFATVASTWNRPGNIVNFAQAAYRQKSRGLMQTTWAGYSLDAERFAREIHQYAAYVLAAEAAWNADRPIDVDTLPYQSAFFDLMGLSPLPPRNGAGWTLDLSAAYNYPLTAADAAGWFGLGPEYDLSAAPAGATRLKGVLFQLPPQRVAGKPDAIVLRSKLTADADLPTRVSIAPQTPTRARQVVVLHTVNFACRRGDLVARYVLEFEDHTTASADITYGENIFAHNDLTVVPEAPLVWQGRTRGGQPVALRALVWTNPEPGKRIIAVTLQAGEAAGAPVVLGITGLD